MDIAYKFSKFHGYNEQFLWNIIKIDENYALIRPKNDWF